MPSGARAINIAAICHFASGDLESALSGFETTLELRRAIDDSEGIVNALNNIGSVAQQRGEYVEALRKFEEARELAEAIGDRNGVAWSLNHSGNIRAIRGEIATAIELLQQSRRIREELGDTQAVADSLHNIGVLYLRTKSFEEARHYLQLSMEMSESIGNKVDAAISLDSIGTTFLDDEPLVARGYFERALAAMESTGTIEFAAITMANIGLADEGCGDLESARDWMQRALACAREAGFHTGVLNALRGLGGVERMLKNFERSAELLEDAVVLSDASDHKAMAEHLHKELSSLYRDQNDIDRAIEHLQRHYEIREQLHSNANRVALHELETTRQLELARKEAEIERIRNVDLAEALRALEESHVELKRTQMQLVQSEKMASLGQLTAGIAHEINNPMAFIRGSTGPLRRDVGAIHAIVAGAIELLPLDERARVEAYMNDHEIEEIRAEIDDLLRAIESGASRTADIVTGLRTFSRLDEDQLKIADLHSGIHSTIALLGTRLSDQITVECVCDGELEIECYPGQINQVVLALLSNSIDAIDGAGSINIMTTRTDGAVRIEIADTGVGIADDIVDKIFDPFFTSKPVGSGQGLGLAIAHGIVAAHGGRIEVVRSSGAGTVMAVELPLRHTSER